MDKKLTLSLNQYTIEKAEAYAKQNNTTLSKMVETYFDSLIIDKNKVIEITPLVQSLCGVIDLPDKFDYKESKTKYLLEKYK